MNSGGSASWRFLSALYNAWRGEALSLSSHELLLSSDLSSDEALVEVGNSVSLSFDDSSSDVFGICFIRTYLRA